MEVIDVEATDIDPLLTHKECSIEKKKSKFKGKTKDSKQEHSNSELETSSVEVQSKLTDGCECGGECFKMLDAEAVYKHRLNIAELTKEEHDMYLMGVTMASLQNRQQTSRNKERQRQRALYVYHGRRVCLDAFLYLENVSIYHLKTIRSHVMTIGVTPRVHGNIGKKPHNSYSLDAYKSAETFVKHFLSNQFNIDTTGTSKPIIVSGVSRKGVYDKFIESGHYPNEKLMGFSTFRHFMAKQFPLIKFSQKSAADKESKTSVTIPLCNTKDILIRSRNNKSSKNAVKLRTKCVKSENKIENDRNILDLDNKKILSAFLSPDESISVVNSESFRF